jgi:hypothetical protein
MKAYELKIILASVTEISDDLGDALFDAGCNDGTIVNRDGEVFIRFTREGDSLEQAINSAATDVDRAGLRVDHVGLPCPI